MDGIRVRFKKLAPFLDERLRRLVAASESLTVGFGGTSVVSRQTGVSRRAIIQGIKELEKEPNVQAGRVRRTGGGRKKTVETDTTLKRDLERLVDPVTRGDPESADADVSLRPDVTLVFVCQQSTRAAAGL